MTKSTYELFYHGGMILAIVLFIAAIVLFFVLKVPKAIGDLTGHTAKKSIKGMKSGGTSSNVSKKEQAKYYNQGSGKIKARETVSEEKRAENRDDTTDALKRTAILNRGRKKDKDKGPDATEVLSNSTYGGADAEETEVLSGGSADTNFTDLSRVDEEETDVLTAAGVEEDAKTDVLKSPMEDDDKTDVLKAPMEDDDKTDVLKAPMEDDDKTDVLKAPMEDDDKTDVLKAPVEDDDKTDVLRVPSYDDDDEDVTSILIATDDEDSTSVLTTGRADILARKVKVMYNVIEVHTDEKL